MKSAIPVPALLLLVTLVPGVSAAQEDIGFVSEHLPEIAMDNRYAQLPVGSSCARAHTNCAAVNFGYALTHSQTLSLDGPMLAVAASHPSGRWNFTGFLFFDSLKLASGIEHRPLDVDFTRDVPYALPAPAEFTHLDGSVRDAGAGFAIGRDLEPSWLAGISWQAGLVWQQVTLRDDRLDYRILDGPDAGSVGSIDYDATYRHFVPFVALAMKRGGERWAWSPHAQLALPLPRRGMAGHITGPGFDLRGNQADAGAGRHFGDPSVTIGLDVTYVPWNLTFDLGSTVTQYLLEPKIHEGVQRDLLLTVHWEGRHRD